ncbi:ABC transporter permease [candidate division KSB1 bacterium]
MKRIKYLVKKELIQLFRDKKLLPPIFVAPILQLILLGYAVTLDVRNITLAVYDKDNSYYSRRLISKFTASGYFTLKDKFDNYTDLERSIQRNKVSMGLVIPSGFENNIKTGEQSPVQLIVDGSDANSSTIGIGYSRAAIMKFTGELLKNINIPVKYSKVNIEFRSWYNPELKSRNFMVPGVLCFLLMIVTMMLTSMVIVKEKEIGTMEQLIVTPVSRVQLIAGKLIPFVLIGFVDINLVLLVSYFWFGIPIKGSLFLLYILSAVFITTTLGLGLFISTISRTQQQAMMTSVFFFMMPFIYLSGFIFPIENMPDIIQFITHFIPLKYFIIIVRGIFLKGNGFDVLWDEFLILLLFGIGIFGLSVFRFNKRLD